MISIYILVERETDLIFEILEEEPSYCNPKYKVFEFQVNDISQLVRLKNAL